MMATTTMTASTAKSVHVSHGMLYSHQMAMAQTTMHKRQVTDRT